MWYSFPFTPSLGLHIAVSKDPLNFEPSGHRFPPNSPQNLHTHFIEGSTLGMSDFNPVVWFTPKPCGTHLFLPHHLAYILQFLKTPLKFEPSGHRFPPNSPQNLYTHFKGGSPLSMSDFNPVVWFTPKPCGTHFLLPHHLAYILQFLKTPLNFEPSGHRFPPNSTQNLYTHFIAGSPLSMSDFNLVVWFTPKTVWYSFPFTPSLGLHIAVSKDPPQL